jgi:hypothetical protein
MKAERLVVETFEMLSSSLIRNLDASKLFGSVGLPFVITEVAAVNPGVEIGENSSLFAVKTG